MNRRTATVTAVVVGILVVGAGGVGTYTAVAGDHQVLAPAPVKVATTEVVRTSLSDYWTESGTVGYRGQRTLKGGAPGVITWLPKSGHRMDRGDTLFRVNDQPVKLFYGGTPMFRDVGQVGLVGRDVRVIADNLLAMGYDIGAQPAPGTRVTVPASEASADPETETPAPTPSSTDDTSYRTVVSSQDAVFTASLKAAVQRWQASQNMVPADGTVPLGQILVLSGAVRVGTTAARVGDDAAGDVMAVSDEQKGISVTIDADRADDVKAGQKVRITLPDSSTTGGTVRSVSKRVDSVTSDDGASDSPKVTVSVTPDQPSALRKIASGDVDVRFAGTTERNVLAVPVGALLALSGGGYGVQISGGAITAVKVGLFTDGQVEISGSGISEGTKVVTTS